MLVFNEGRGRTTKEYQRLLDEADLKMTHIFATETDSSLIEARNRFHAHAVRNRSR